jgi:hypothetical protein
VRIFGTIAYDWRATTQEAVTTPTRRGQTPAAVVDLCDDLVTVGRLAGGTQLIAWEWIRELHGWAPVPKEYRR